MVQSQLKWASRIPIESVEIMSNALIDVRSETARIRAAFVNSGNHSFAEADSKLAASKVYIILSNDAADTPAGQAAFLTAVATATRSFGQIFFAGAVDQKLLRPLPGGALTLRDAGIFLGAHFGVPDGTGPQILIGASLYELSGWAVRAFWDGWTAGVAPAKAPIVNGCSECPLAGVAAGALAVGQTFFREQGDIRAGRTTETLSLWSPDPDFLDVSTETPHFSEILLPTQLWLVGLGNLGQAYVWSLSQLPYPHPREVTLFLQDDQTVERENWGTSVLVQRGQYGILKTRLTEEWSNGCGFVIRRIDRRLDEHFLRLEREPSIVLAGLDTMPARNLLDRRGFQYIIDAGLGSTFVDYRKIRVSVFDSTGSLAEHFQGVEDQTMQTVETLMKLPAYKELALQQDDGACGAAMLAESSVAVPFVSAIAGAFAIVQAIRITSGYPHYASITADVGDLRTLRASIGPIPSRTEVPGTRPSGGQA